MKYRILQTPEAENDIFQLADYMVNTLTNHKAANDFLNRYYQMAESLETFPFGYRGISFEYRGYEIRLKPYDFYHIFFIVDTNRNDGDNFTDAKRPSRLEITAFKIIYHLT